MMKFSAGYRLFPDNEYINNLTKRKDSLSEVYFSWGDFPNGRSNLYAASDMTPWEAQAKQISDLKAISDAGIKLNLLFNATCYGNESQSRAFFEKVGETTDYIQTHFGLSTITTTSLLIAKFIKSNFKNIEIRASVNMGVGTPEAIEYTKDYFDSYYLKRELNRNIKSVRIIKSVCDEMGKKLHLLANSGCLNNCPAHTFHDNLVSHEDEIRKRDNGYAFEGICTAHLNEIKSLQRVLDITGFVRPEDTALYEGLTESFKLATRASANPEAILKAYIDDKAFTGSSFELTEPNHTAALYPLFLQNCLIKASWDEDMLYYTIK